MTGDVRLLCTGDLHLGQHPSRIPSSLDGKQFSPREVWQSTVQKAIDANVDAVVISGDIVDRENRYFEAFGAFEQGANRLAEAEIPLVVVSGNHDFDVLPRMVDELSLENLQLLGRDGQWENWTLRGRDEPLVQFTGWSFPTEQVMTSPLEDLTFDPHNDVPTVGMLHADLDTTGSPYAPVKTGELGETPIDCWVLGHIHRPTVHESSDPLVFYPGSPQALDPGERGTHGPWIVEIDKHGTAEWTQHPLASVQYDTISVDVSGVEDSKGIAGAISDRISEHVQSEVPTEALELYLPRIRLEGRTEAHSELEARKHEIESQLSLSVGSLSVEVERLELATKPAVDLHELADGKSPVAYLADLLLALGEEDEQLTTDQSAVIDDALTRMKQAHAARTYTPLKREGRIDQPDEMAARETLRTQARLLLDTLLDQREADA